MTPWPRVKIPEIPANPRHKTAVIIVPGGHGVSCGSCAWVGPVCDWKVAQGVAKEHYRLGGEMGPILRKLLFSQEDATCCK